MLKALDHMGYRPAAIVGVSMGSVVGAMYALRPDDWYEALLSFGSTGFPVPVPVPASDLAWRLPGDTVACRGFDG